MASRKKQSEGIALLSMYNDEEEDEEMEEADNEEEKEEFQELRIVEDTSMADSDRVVAGDSGAEESTPRDDVESSPATPSRAQASMDSERGRSRRGKLGIVDYGHDEVAMSPDPEEREMDRIGHDKVHADRQFANGDNRDIMPPGMAQVLTPSNQSAQFYDPSKSDKVNYAVADAEAGNAAESIEVEEKDAEPLDSFLPPAPKAKCSEELQRKINKFLDYKKSGKSFNAEVRNRKDYRNPDFLLHAVSYQDINQIGSCFSKDVFDPHGYDKADFYDEIEADMRREMDRKEQERKKSQKVEFLSVGTQTGIVPGAAKINLPVPGIPTGLQSAPSSDAVPRDGSRQNKKSKWDKVDGDQKNPTLIAGAQSAVLSAVNSGAGYMAFMQQKRREAEEKRSSDRKLERRS